jgi:SAM-dependent methyltransferase
MPLPDIVAVNRSFYDALWGRARLQRPDRFNTWPMISELLPSATARLELGPGLRPRLPIAGTLFIDVSAPAVAQLNARGGLAALGEIGTLPFGDRLFDLVCAFDVIEHVADDGLVFREVSRVLKDDGVFLCSVPLHSDRWTEFDDWVGHARRYHPAALMAMLTGLRFTVDKSAAFGMGMQPANSRWVKRGMWYLAHRRAWAMFWYNRVGMPLAMRFQKRLHIVTGLIDTAGVDEILILCRREPRREASCL